MSSDAYPLISIFTVVKNGAKTIRRCVDSVLALDYPNFEHVIQDGASTDGTLEILQEYARKTPGVIKVVSESDSCSEEGFFRGFKRCRGEWIGSCLADEALLPQAGKWAMAAFQQHTRAGAIYGDLYITDGNCRIQSEFKAPHPFTLERYLLHEVNPPFASSFFRRQALEKIGIKTHPWIYGMGEFELWVRLSAKYPVEYIPGLVATYAVHSGQLSSSKGTLLKLVNTRFAYLKRLFEESDIKKRFGPIFPQVMGGMHLFAAEVLRETGSYPEAADLLLRANTFRPIAEHNTRLMQGFYSKGAQLFGAKNYKDALMCWSPLVKLSVNIPEFSKLKDLCKQEELSEQSVTVPIETQPKTIVGGPLVSVIVNCHNYADHLGLAVGSVLAQTYANYELVIIDDGSTDDSLKIAQSFAAEHGKVVSIRVFHLDDVGPSTARRFGFEQARGSYIVPLDADDKMAPRFLEKTVAVLEADPKLGFAYTDTDFFGDKIQRVNHPEYDFTRLCTGNFIAYCSLIRRKAFEAVDGYDRGNWGYYEDWDLWIRLGEAGWHGKHIAESLFLYNHHFGSSLSAFSVRLDVVYRAYLIKQHPKIYAPNKVADATQILAEMPPGWHAQPPLKDSGKIQALLAQYPGNRHLQYFLALAQARNGHHRDAVVTLSTLLARHPKDEQARKILKQFSAEAARKLHSDNPLKPVDAAKISDADQPNGENLNILKTQAQELLTQEKWSEAAEICADLIVKAPDDQDILFIFAHALANLGAVEDALTVAKRLVVLQPDKGEFSDLADMLENALNEMRAQALKNTGPLEVPTSASNSPEAKLVAGRFDTDKGQGFLSQYEKFFGHLTDKEVKILEIGVLKGGSLLMWQDYFKKGQITGLDLNPVSLNDKAERIRIYQGYQQDGSLLARIRKERAPEGFDIIIDDASHLGNPTRETFNHLFDRHLKPGGIYVVEDWGTGYWDSFPDGKAFTEGEPHHAGMVGFIKELVDEAGMDDLSKTSRGGSAPSRETKFEGVYVTGGQVFIVKKAPVTTSIERQASPAPKQLVSGKFDTDKGQGFLDQYERHFGPMVDAGVRLLEIGVFKGGSLLMWQDYFKKGQITGLDLNPVLLKEEAERIRIYQGYQQDDDLLGRIRNERAPDGFDIIIDDASHLGSLTRETFNHLFDRHLKPGGIYVIEDWGTGYWDTFPDGKKFVQGIPHNAGMVGFIKELVDEAGMGDITKTGYGGISPARESKFEGVYITGGQVFVTKKHVQVKKSSIAADVAQSATNPETAESSNMLVEHKVAPETAKSMVAAAKRIIALVSAYNEGDVIYHVVGDLIANGVEVYFIDNNSTDNTIAEAGKWLGKGLLKIERFPQDAGLEYSKQCEKEYVWSQILRRKEELATQLGADWYIHADADEFRESPWPGKTLAEAIAEVDAQGYSAINFELLNFRPTDDAFVPGADVRQHLVGYEKAEILDVLQIKAWKNPDQRVQLVAQGGHSVEFSGRRVFPLNFILRHYPIRGETHGRRKVFKDRVPRFAREEVAKNWHIQYNSYVNGTAKFLYAPVKLERYNDGEEVRAKLLSEYSDDEKLVASFRGQEDDLGVLSNSVLCAWVGEQLGLSGSLPLEVWQQAEHVLGQLLSNLAAGKKDLDQNIEPGVVRLLIVLLKVKSAFARFSGHVRLVKISAILSRHLVARLPVISADSHASMTCDSTPVQNAESLALSAQFESSARRSELPRNRDAASDEIFGADEVQSFELLASAYSNNPADARISGQLRQLQQVVMNFLVTAETGKFEALFRGNFGRVFRALVQSGLSRQPPSEAMRARLATLEEDIAKSARSIDVFDVRPLLALMLVVPAERYAAAVPAEKLPAWLLADWRGTVLPVAADETSSLTAFQKAIQTGEELVRSGRIQEAQVKMEQVLKLAPNAECAARAEEIIALIRDAVVNHAPAAPEEPPPLSNDFFGSAECTAINELVAAYTADPGNPDSLAQMNSLRQGLANYLIGAESPQFDELFSGNFGKVYRIVLNCGMTSEPGSKEQLANVKAMAADMGLSQNGPGELAFARLLALMLFSQAHQTSVPLALEKIPAWFLDDYLGYVLFAPKVFTVEGEADMYRLHMLNWASSIHRRVQNAPNEALTKQVAHYFAIKANYIPLYFNHTNTKELTEKRAAIMEFTVGKAGGVLQASFRPRSHDAKKIHVGYLNAHFSTQTETHVTLPCLHLDRSKFDLSLFALVANGGPVEDYCRSLVDRFEVLPADLSQQVSTIRRAELDVIIIGTNVTAVTNQIALLALHRLAPVQLVNYCSPVSTGMRHVDGYLSGTFAGGKGGEEHFSEKLYLCDGPPGCLDYTVENKVPVARFNRQGMGISETDVIFVNAAACFKILPEMQETWAKIVKAVDNSRLLLLPFNPNWSNSFPVKQFTRTLRSAFHRHGMGEDRIMLSGSLPSRADVKELEKIADVYLDTFPFSGSISVIDPLELGIPSVVWEGKTHRSRMAAALLRELAIPELIAHDERSYIDISVHLATDATFRQTMKSRILDSMARKPRFINPAAYGKQLSELLEREVMKKPRQINGSSKASDLKPEAAAFVA